MLKIVVTGCAGFIGSHVCEKLLAEGNNVIGIDNFDAFYDRKVKESNLLSFSDNERFLFKEVDLINFEDFAHVFSNVDVVIHLAGKAGVRPSILDPQSYIDHNISASKNVLEAMRQYNVKKMLFASSSSVYGNNTETPWIETLNVDNPISPYAFSKKSCELLNHTYHHLYNIDIINLRFFTVFGPRQRPDLAIYKFVKMIENGEPITMFGDGSTSRDYTFIADIVNGIFGALKYILKEDCVFDTANLGSFRPIKLIDLIHMIGDVTGKKPVIERQAMKLGDVNTTYADVTKAKDLFKYYPQTNLRDGIVEFVNWYRNVKRLQEV